MHQDVGMHAFGLHDDDGTIVLTDLFEQTEPAPVEYVDDLYGGGIEDIIEVISRAPADARTLLVIGHAPGIPATAYELATTAQLSSTYAVAGSESGSTDDENPAIQRLRHFSACAFAVLGTEGSWTEIADRGASLTDVHHPGD